MTKPKKKKKKMAAPSEDSDQPGQWVANNPSFLHADSEVFAVRSMGS